MSDVHDPLLKVALVGDLEVGKTSLLWRYADHSFDAAFRMTMRNEFYIRSIDLEGTAVRLQAWDTTMRRERYMGDPLGCLRHIDGVIVCYDLNHKASFESCSGWLEEISKRAAGSTNLLLVGTQCDAARREVSYEDGQAFADANQMLFFETSARANINVEEAFAALAAAIWERLHPAPIVFTLLAVTAEQSAWQVSLATLSGETHDIVLNRSDPTVGAAAHAIAQSRGISVDRVKLMTVSGQILNLSALLPGADAIERTISMRRCSVQ